MQHSKYLRSLNESYVSSPSCWANTRSISSWTFCWTRGFRAISNKQKLNVAEEVSKPATKNTYTLAAISCSDNVLLLSFAIVVCHSLSCWTLPLFRSWTSNWKKSFRTILSFSLNSSVFSVKAIRNCSTSRSIIPSPLHFNHFGHIAKPIYRRAFFNVTSNILRPYNRNGIFGSAKQSISIPNATEAEKKNNWYVLSM